MLPWPALPRLSVHGHPWWWRRRRHTALRSVRVGAREETRWRLVVLLLLHPWHAVTLSSHHLRWWWLVHSGRRRRRKLVATEASGGESVVLASLSGEQSFCRSTVTFALAVLLEGVTDVDGFVHEELIVDGLDGGIGRLERVERDEAVALRGSS